MTLGRRLAVAVALSLWSASAATAQVKLGVGAPSSGPDAVFGAAIRLGVDQAVADTNAAGGLLGQRIEIVFADDGNEPKKGVDVAKNFVAAHVPFVVGHASSAVTVAASAVYAEGGTLDITPTAMAPLVTDRGIAMMFRTCGRDDEQAGVIAGYLATHRIAKVAILHDRTAGGKALADAVRKDLAARGTREVFYGSLDKGSRDYAGLVQRLKASGAQVVVWGGGATEAGLLARQMRDGGSRAVLLGGTAMASEDFANLAGAAADGALMVFPKDPRQRPEAASLLRRLKAQGIEPDSATFYAYAAVQVLRQGSEAARSLEPVRVAAAMHGGAVFKTVVGDLAFDAKGDPLTPDYAIYVWHRTPGGRMAYDDLADS